MQLRAWKPPSGLIVRHSVVLFVLLVFLGQLPCQISGQQTSSNIGTSFRPDPTCVCDPLCQIYPSARAASCTRVPRADCPCCFVCASEVGEACEDVIQPCNVAKKLDCDPVEKVCKGKTVNKVINIY